ncbi:hypothetical protein STCU_06589 [Strigomonas culicis]|uniref:Uncharacterized protein n=1 Tax=Strigomonas culicis TaxID=28005 RepID=S9UA97_9TRYP|nr:hypothetical protein STCU_06589 [Strigomonas culicis]|eukprot:EPY25654.1 hypothetical protein STCU_06589 [Strigomonas culicis]
MYHLEADGSATVYGLPVSPFIPIQHLQIDVTAVNRIAGYSLSFCRERGWTQTEAEVQHRYNVDTEKGTLPNTFFYGGWQASLYRHSSLTGLPVDAPSTLLSWCSFHVSHVGTSSYSVHGEVYVYLEGKMEERQHLGNFKVTSVQVSKASRQTTPITPRKREVLRDAFEGSAAWRARIQYPTVERLNVQALFTGCGLFTTDSALHKVQERRPGEPLTQPFCFRRFFHLRETDIDFNLHLNQLAATYMIVNTYRGALGDARSGLSVLLPASVPPLRADLLLRRIRIDYVREVPMDHKAFQVFLFPYNDGARACLTSMSEKGRSVEEEAPEATGEDPTVSLGFITVGVPHEGAGNEFLASAGFLSVAI